MLSQTLDKILSAEQQAAEKTEQAKKQAEEIIADARRQADEIIEKARQASHAEADRLISENKALIDKLLGESSKAAPKRSFRNKAAGAGQKRQSRQSCHRKNRFIKNAPKPKEKEMSAHGETGDEAD